MESLASPLLLGMAVLGAVSSFAARGEQGSVLQQLGVSVALAAMTLALIVAWMANLRWRETRVLLAGVLAVAAPALVWTSQATVAPAQVAVARESVGSVIERGRDGIGVFFSLLLLVALVAPKRRRVVTLGIAASAGCAVATALAASDIESWFAPSLGEKSIRGVAIPVLWATLAVLALAQSRRHGPIVHFLAPALGMLATAQIVSPARLQEPDDKQAAFVGLLGIFAMIALIAGFSYELRVASAEQRRRVVFAEMESASRGSQLEAERLVASRRSHDQKASFLAIEAVVKLLTESTAIDDPARARLISAATAELTRLRGEAVAQPSETDLRELVEPVVALASATGAQVEMEVRSGLTVVVGPDFPDVVRNLISNAMAHGGNAGIRVQARRVDLEFVELSVSDCGPGVRGRKRHEIFAHGCGSGKSGHSGVGLDSARAHLRALGGDLLLDRTYGEGARFVARIPTIAQTTS